jgi:hypothetical protein
MNGYGIDGDVANGSFEEIAPFGGYGWRYYTDIGVSRIHDSGGAHDGDYYLRLANGAASHQPNPAMDGETFTVTAWMRGASNGDQVAMSVDFRDQNMWTAPLEVTTETIVLTTDWMLYKITATAPTDTSNPVFHTRLTFQAAAGSTVDIDQVAMSLGDIGNVNCEDTDGDGYGSPGHDTCREGADTDCNDSDASVNPGATEICANGVDDDCNILTAETDPLLCPIPVCALRDEPCSNNSDCCDGICSKGKPSSRVCL